ncbi:MAG: UDP-N-acetylmuramoyl-tripeptide--D-alanyl-D-alanine ligase [Gemmatimonadetes bacterium]|nr:UDP-N-acetylmuramoyl-tripeptide--D-alanyl-D-alanine ligase [Gemmatimonadota bacterium]
MTWWTGTRVAGVLGTPAPPDVAFTGISTDSRSLRPGELFVALEGGRFDGHRFLDQALQAGARGAVVRRATGALAGLVLFEVQNTLVALGDLARARRQEIRGPVVAVTGSNGKTATRAMLAASLGTRWPTHATRENLNNLVGVPLTIVEAPDRTEALVVECGASEPGEIARLRGIVEPTVGVVTNVTAAHLAGFGSSDTALREKVSLLEGTSLAVVGQRPAELAALARRVARRVVTAGLAPGGDVTPDHWHVDQQGRPILTFRGTRIALPLVGRHQGDNAMVALAVAADLELDLTAVAGALERVALPHGRCEVVTAGDLVLINDTYNANPASFSAALEVARSLRGNRPLVTLVGSMLELGSASPALHQHLAEQILALRPDLVGAVGEFAAVFERHRLGARLIVAPDADALGRAVAPRLKGGELVLLKASRGVQLEQAIPHLLSGREASCSTTS